MARLKSRAKVAALGLALPLCACGSDGSAPADTDSGGGTGSGTEPGDTESGGTGPATGVRPFRGPCEVVIDQPFPFLDASGAAQIAALSIGGTETSDNFTNRGDVVVEYANTDRITVEMCRFTTASTELRAEEDFSSLHIWAYDASGSPRPPAAMDPEDDCVDSSGIAPWRHDCQIRVWFDGQLQLARSGADLRVTLPSGYPYDLNITTQDNNEGADYHNRGDVCVNGLRGSTEIALGSGQAYIILAADTNPMPECPDALLQECVANAWDPDLCPCLAEQFSFSQTRVVSHDASSANITLDLPTTSPPFWAAVSLSNEGEQVRGTAPVCADDDVTLGARCDACVDPSVGAFEISPALGDDTVRDPWRNLGNVNYPGASAINGAGYSVELISSACQAVSSTATPDDFVGVGNGDQQEVDERGNITVCSGCVRAGGCEALVPF